MRLPKGDAVDRSRARGAVDTMDTSEDSPEVRGEGSAAGDLHLAPVLGEEAARTHM